MNELNWSLPDRDLTYNQTLIYSSSSKYGTYTLLTTLSDIRVTSYIDVSGTSSTWYKIRFYDSTNLVYSSYSDPMPATSTVSNLNYTNPKTVAFHLGTYRTVVAETVGTGDGNTLVFGPVSDPKIIEDTETVYVDGVEQQRNVAYTTDYDVGKIIFTAGNAPTLATAITMDYWASTACVNSRVIDAIKRSEEEINRNLRRTFYQPQTVTEYVDSFDPLDTKPYAYEARNFNDMAQDYQPKMNEALYSRLLKMEKYPISTMYQVVINAQPTSTTSEAVGTGAGVETEFTLDNTPVIYGSETVYVAGTQTTAYTIDYESGTITFTSAPTGAITADYTYCTSGVVVDSTDYLVREDSGLIYLKSTVAQVKQNPLICAVTYAYGYDSVPGIIEHLATLHAGVEVMYSTIMGAPQQQDVLRSNLAFLKKDIDDIYGSLGKVMEIVRI